MIATTTKNAARDTVIQSENVQEDIRHIVVQALTEGKMEPEAIKQTLVEVFKGASEGLDKQTEGSGDALKQVVTGIDEALSQAAEASKLAIEEASGNIQEFSDHDIKLALNDLQDLESLFFSTLSEVSNQGKETTKKTLDDLLHHMQSSGSSVGQSVNEMITGLHRDLSKGGRLQKIQAADVAKAAGAAFARISSGILAGIADSLDPDKK